MTKGSQALFKAAQTLIPGGVNSPVRAFRSVGSHPIFIKKGQGAYVTDVDGNEYIDYVGSWGPLILGHTHPYVLEQVSQALKNGFSFGASTEVETELAKRICNLMPSIELIRFVNSGTEAAMSAIRVARGYTKRDKILKFAGCYHGHADSLLVSAGSGGLTFGVPSSAGVPESISKNTLVAEFNDLNTTAALFDRYGSDIAAVIVEPIAANMNLVFPSPNFLYGLRQLCDEYNSLLIFDEVITGFRIGLGGAQEHYQITPDLTILGKVIGGGFPVAAFGGRADVMQMLAPLGPVYQAGTLSGNPIAMAAGIATLDLVCRENFYAELSETTTQLVSGLNKLAKNVGINFHAASIGGIFGMYFTNNFKITTEDDVKKCDIQSFTRFFHGMLNAGIYLAPSAYEVGFVSIAHRGEEINKTLIAAEHVFNSFKLQQSVNA